MGAGEFCWEIVDAETGADIFLGTGSSAQTSEGGSVRVGGAERAGGWCEVAVVREGLRIGGTPVGHGDARAVGGKVLGHTRALVDGGT